MPMMTVCKFLTTDVHVKKYDSISYHPMLKQLLLQPTDIEKKHLCQVIFNFNFVTDEKQKQKRNPS